MLILLVALIVLGVVIYPIIGILLAGGFKKLDKNIFGLKPRRKGYSGGYYDNKVVFIWIVGVWPVFLAYIAVVGIPLLIFYYPFVAYNTLYKKVMSA